MPGTGPTTTPDSSLSRRLVVVRGLLREALARIAADEPAEIRLVSACAGDGRDLLPVLAGAAARGMTGRLRCRLIELDPALAAAARHRAAAAGLTGVQVVASDAGLAEAYEGIAPAHLVLMSGVLGNITERDAQRTITALRALTAARAGWSSGPAAATLTTTPHSECAGGWPTVASESSHS